MKFPKITHSQVALIRADTFTGNILDEKFNLYISDSQIGYSVFNSKEEAIIYIRKIQMKKENIEFTILNSNEEVIYYCDGLNGPR